MTAKELLAKAKAVGGWFVSARGEIRTDAIKTDGDPSCPVEVVYGTIAKCPQDLFYSVALAADNDTDLFGFDPELRKEMESWCK